MNKDDFDRMNRQVDSACRRNWIDAKVREYNERNEFLGEFDESKRDPEFAYFKRNGEEIKVRKMLDGPDDPRSPQDMQVCHDEYMAFLYKMEREDKFNRRFSR